MRNRFYNFLNSLHPWKLILPSLFKTGTIWLVRKKKRFCESRQWLFFHVLTVFSPLNSSDASCPTVLNPLHPRYMVFFLFLHICIGSGKEDFWKSSDQGGSRLVINVPVTNGDKTRDMSMSYVIHLGSKHFLPKNKLLLSFICTNFIVNPLH